MSDYYVGALVMTQQSVDCASITLRTVLEPVPREYSFPLSPDMARKRLMPPVELLGIDVENGVVTGIHTMAKTVRGIQALKAMGGPVDD